MIFKDYFGFIVGTIVMLILNAVMAIAGMLVSGVPITYAAFVQSWGTSYVINTIAALILPINAWADGVCHTCKAKPGTLKHQLLNTLILTVCNMLCVLLGVTSVNVGFNSHFWPAFVSMIPIMFPIAYVVALLSGIFAVKVAEKIVHQ